MEVPVPIGDHAILAAMSTKTPQSSCPIPKKPEFDENGRIRLTRLTSKGG